MLPIFFLFPFLITLISYEALNTSITHQQKIELIELQNTDKFKRLSRKKK